MILQVTTKMPQTHCMYANTTHLWMPSFKSHTCFWLQKEVSLMSQNIIAMSDNTVTIADPESKNDRQITFDSCHWSHDGFEVNEEGVAMPQGHGSRFSGQVNRRKIMILEREECVIITIFLLLLLQFHFLIIIVVYTI